MTEIQQLIKTHGEQGASKDCHDHQFDDTRNSMYLTYRRGHDSLASLLEMAIIYINSRCSCQSYFSRVTKLEPVACSACVILENLKKELAK